MGAVNPTPRTDEIVNRGDVWMAALDQLRPVVVLSRLDNDDLRCVVAVEPANEVISGVAVEVDLGLNGHVVRVALPRPGRINCTWVLTLSQEDLIEKVGTLSSAKLSEVENLILVGDQVSTLGADLAFAGSQLDHAFPETDGSER
jgi:mRNA interferase MazF